MSGLAGHKLTSVCLLVQSTTDLSDEPDVSLQTLSDASDVPSQRTHKQNCANDGALTDHNANFKPVPTMHGMTLWCHEEDTFCIRNKKFGLKCFLFDTARKDVQSINRTWMVESHGRDSTTHPNPMNG